MLGLGKPSKDGEKVSDGTGLLLGKSIANVVASESKVTSCTVIIPHLLKESATMSDISSSIYSSMYSDNRYRTGEKIKKIAEDLKSITLVAEASELAQDAVEAIQLGMKLAKGIALTKDIVNSPHNVLNSLSLANTAKRIADQSNGVLTCTILDKAECEKRGMGAYLAVARGSETDPQFIHLTYTPKNSTANKKVAIVGKGLLFDTGGYNIKTQMMDLMKFDCGGSAAVFGAARVIAEMAPEGVEAHFIVAACENMINSRAMVPSDVLTASNGKTIEVGNTDAEGRLTLADALVYADKEVGCDAIIELSTLTGACMVSLGKAMAGFWTTNDDLAKDLETVSKVTGEKIWRMPLETSYNEQLDSKIADLNNIGSPYGGAITAALFLQNFVSKKKPFAHIDIAGPVWNEKTGATGYGTRLVAEWIKRQGS
jgi:leucyl aminopeptidase